MTFDEWDHELPNGFHDARISNIEIDYVRGLMTLKMGLLTEVEQGEVDHCAEAVVLVSGLQFCSIGAPFATYPYQKRAAITVSGDPAKSDHLPELNGLTATFPKNTTCYRFFVHDWNSFIYIAAVDVQVRWVGNKEISV
jgi:hypothetical protein